MKNKKSNNILKDAINVVYDRSSEKAKEYGPFDESMASAARIASELTGKDITTIDFYKCMMALKLARLKYSNKEDTLMDLVAYTGAMHKSQEDLFERNKIWINENNSKIIPERDTYSGDHAIDALTYNLSPLREFPNDNSNEFDKNNSND